MSLIYKKRRKEKEAKKKTGKRSKKENKKKKSKKKGIQRISTQSKYILENEDIYRYINKNRKNKSVLIRGRKKWLI